MAFTREFIRNAAKESGVEIPKELEDALVQEHLAARDAFAEGKVKAALEENKPDPAPKVKDTQEYKDLKKAFDDYKAEQEGKAATAAKEKAVRAYYESKNITGDNLTIAMMGSKDIVGGLELDGETIKDTSALDALVNGAFARLKTTTTVKGAVTPNPPANNGGSGTMTKDQIMAIKDRSERRAAIAANMDLFTNNTKGD